MAEKNYGSVTDKCSVFYFLILRGEIRKKKILDMEQKKTNPLSTI